MLELRCSARRCLITAASISTRPSRVTYLLRQRFRYDYAGAVAPLRQRLVIVPPARHGDQYRRAAPLDVSGRHAPRAGSATTPRATSWPALRADTVEPERSSSG